MSTSSDSMARRAHGTGSKSRSTTPYEELVEEDVFDVEHHARQCERRILIVVIFSIVVIGGFATIGIYLMYHHLNNHTNSTNQDESTCPLNPQYPMSGGAGCSSQCDIGRFSSSLNYEGEWPESFMDKMKNVSIEMEEYLIGIGEESSILIMDYWDLSIHMTMDYFCCLSHPEMEIVDSIVANHSWPKMDIQFDSIICTDDGSHNLQRYPNGTFIEVVVFASVKSQEILLGVVTELEQIIYNEGEVPIVVGRDDNIPFHVTIGFVNGSRVVVPDLVDKLNEIVNWWGDETITIENGPICSENVSPVDGVNYTCLTG